MGRRSTWRSKRSCRPEKEEEAKQAEDEKLANMQKQAMLADVQANAVKVQAQVAGEAQTAPRRASSHDGDSR